MFMTQFGTRRVAVCGPIGPQTAFDLTAAFAPILPTGISLFGTKGRGVQRKPEDFFRVHAGSPVAFRVAAPSGGRAIFSPALALAQSFGVNRFISVIFAPG
jgi:hypothetical protein